MLPTGNDELAPKQDADPQRSYRSGHQAKFYHAAKDRRNLDGGGPINLIILVKNNFSHILTKGRKRKKVKP